jgi:prepilin-type N-terminal cleavage/methylation domain-containing protein
MSIKQTKGFTLIEILIVVAIIAILASVVLVGLGPTQQAGRDARRLSDLHEVQNGLELYYNKTGKYPELTTASWASLQATLTGASIGVSSIPNDPSTGKSYVYAWNSGATQYELAATMESSGGSEWVNYNAPTGFTSAGITDSATLTCSQTSLQYCISL